MKTYKKIDLFFNGDYVCSTNQAKTCKQARQNFIERLQRYTGYLSLVDKQILKRPDLLKARFDKDAK